MKHSYAGIVAIVAVFLLASCQPLKESTETKTSKAVQRQQAQYVTAQPVPAFDWSLERDLIIQLYGIRNMKAVTHSVWRGLTSQIEGDCPSIGLVSPSTPV